MKVRKLILKFKIKVFFYEDNSLYLLNDNSKYIYKIVWGRCYYYVNFIDEGIEEI